MAGSVDRFGPKMPRSSILIKHRPSHLNKGLILAFNNANLSSHIWRQKRMLKSQIFTKGLKISIPEFRYIVTMNRSHGILEKLILQPKNQISSMSKILILHPHEEYPRIARKVVNNHKHIPHPPPEKANLSWTNIVHVKQFAGLCSHHNLSCQAPQLKLYQTQVP
jgi:hypothetical protein